MYLTCSASTKVKCSGSLILTNKLLILYYIIRTFSTNLNFMGKILSSFCLLKYSRSE